MRCPMDFLANRDRTKKIAKIRQLHDLPETEKSAEKSVYSFVDLTLHTTLWHFVNHFSKLPRD